MNQRQQALHDLEAHFAEIVESFDGIFDSHQFILQLAQRHQHAYIRALDAFNDTENPFRILHGQIARRLLAHKDLARKIGSHPSENIFGEKSEVALWERR